MANPGNEASDRAPRGDGPRVFIGVPVYNGERFLSEALDSLLAQTYKDFTLLISDNASTDRTPEICARYAGADPRVRYVRQPSNLGAPGNWNFVAQAAQGEYFKWASANDTCSPTMLARCVEALDADPTAVLCQGRTCLVDEDTGAAREYDRDLALMATSPSERLKQLGLRLALNNGQAGVIRLSMLRQTRLERKYEGGDYPLMAELALLGRFLVLPEVLHYRRMGSSTFSRGLQGERLSTFYGKQAGAVAGRLLDMHLDMMRSAFRLPLPVNERVAAGAFLLRKLAWRRSEVLAEVAQALKSKMS